MSNALQMLKDFCRYLFVERNCEGLLSLLSQDVCWLGNNESEGGNSIAEAQAYLASEIAAMPGSYQLEISAEKQRVISEQSGTAMLRLKLTCGEIFTRVSVLAVTKPENGLEKICSLQMAVIDAYRQPGEDYITTKTKVQIADAKTKLALSTMSGGLMGGYIKPGFPFYFINDRMLEYLGYANEEAFIADIDGLIENCMHPDDRARVNAEVERQLPSGGYTVDYRMKKCDGSYIWVHDIGKKTLSENGEPVIISVCYDISEEHKKQIQLDNLVDALPGGAVLYRKEGDQLRLLYQSKGACKLSGHTPEQFEKLVSEDICNSVYRDDANKVKAAISQAATSNETVSLDFRILHVNGGTVWVSASYKRISTEDGCPVIYAVFSEMPQLRELMSDVVENSGVSIIVSDSQTRELLYANKAALSAVGKADSKYEGKICHKYLLNSATPCSFCKDLHFDTSIEQTTENYVPQIDRYFITQGRLVNWAGRIAHVECMMDITAAKKSQQQLNEMLDNITCGVVVSRRKGKKSEVLFLNKGFCELFEQDAATLHNRFANESTTDVYKEDLPNFKQMKMALQHGIPHAEATFRYRCSESKTKWIHVDVNTVYGVDKAYTTYASYYDVTEQMQQEQQLSRVIHNVPGGVCLYRWDGKNLHPLVVSNQFYTLCGEPTNADLNEAMKMLYRHVHPDDLQGLQQAFHSAFEKVGKFEHTYRLYKNTTNKCLWIKATGVVVPQTDGTQLAYVSYTDVTDQKLTEQRLLASERAIDFATEEAGLWYWQYDANKDCAYFGERCMRDFDLPAVMENYSQAWFASGSILPEYRAIYDESIQKINNGESQVRFEVQLKDSHGLIHWSELRFSNPPQEHSLVVCTARIIDYEKSLVAKYEMERQKPSLGETDLLFHAVFDLSSGTTKEYGSTVSDATLLKQYPTMEQSIAFVVANTIDEAEKKEILRLNNVDYLLDQFLHGNTSFSTDYRRRLPNGTTRWVRNILRLVEDPTTRKPLLFEYCYDITSRKMLEEVLRLSAGQDYECVSTVNFKLDNFSAYSGREHEICDNYHSYKDVIQSYAESRILPENRKAFLLGTAPDTVMKNISEQGSYSFTIKSLRADGSEKIERLRYRPYDVKEQLYVLTRMDATDILKAEELQNRRLQEALDIAQQANSAKSNFLASMSHDMRTPMNAIIGMCALAIEDEGNASQVHESLSTIQSSSELLLGLINNILDMNRIESGNMTLNNQDFSITQELRKSKESFRVLAEQKNLSFKLFTNIVHDSCHGDASRIHSALDNILSNAIKYTPNGGTVTYRVTELPTSSEKIGHYRFEITDTGVGMSKETQAHMFESLYRGKEAIASKMEGTGLGLSISKAIIDLKGGTISCNSKEGAGTTFIVELPIPLSSNLSKSSHQDTGKTLHQYDFSKVHILMCEDHPINQKVTTRVLEKVGAKVTIANDGEIGVETFLNSPVDAFDLILMDVRMPNMDGYEATQAIRQSNHPRAKTIPIIAMTANAYSEDVQKSIEVGMNEHLAKPITPDQLYKVIDLYTGNNSQAFQKKKVLFVDDVELNIAVLTAAIQNEYTTLIARNGQEALAVLEANPDIAAVITDIMMPGIDGMTLIKTIRANNRYQNVAVIANTQYGDTGQEEKLRALGADDFLYKPTTPEQVKARLKVALAKYGS